MPPVKRYSPRSRSKIRFDVCRCFFGTSLSASRIWSMIPVNPSSFGRGAGWLRRYPGGTENANILATVRGSTPNTRAASRLLIPSTEGLPAGAGRFTFGVQLQILKYDVVGHVSRRCGKISSRPEPPAPVSFTQAGKLHLYLAR